MLHQIAVIGSGSWATAIVKILAESPAVGTIHWWMRKTSYVTYFDTYAHNPNYLSSVEFDPQKVKATDSLSFALQSASIVVLAIPSAFIKETLAPLEPKDFENKKWVTAVKGLVPDSIEVVSDFLHTKFGVSPSAIACVSGPCHAEEVARERLSYLTIAADSAQLSASIAQLFQCRFIHTSVSDDIRGIEYAAVLKNVYAIAAGIANGLGYGDNFKAVLISFCLREMEHFLAKLGIENSRVNESAYLGDLLVTAYSQFSRNRTFGNMLGRDYSVSSAQMEMKMVAEGYYSAKQLFLLNQKVKANLPVLDAVYAIIYEAQSPAVVFERLAKEIN
jgi:glycerol-3-phosphate dehydrogenase (NAD(P)+)